MTRFCHHLSTDIFPSIQALMQPLPDEIAGKGTGFRHQIKSTMLGRGTRSETICPRAVDRLRHCFGANDTATSHSPIFDSGIRSALPAV